MELLQTLPSKLIVMAICSALFWLGGFCFLAARRFILPTILTGYALFLTHDLWCLMMFSVIAIFCLGYGVKSPLRHVFGDGWGRGVWGLLSAICLSLPLFLTHNLGLSFWPQNLNNHFGPAIFLCIYLTLNFTFENALKKISQFIGDPVIGLGFSSILLLIK